MHSTYKVSTKAILFNEERTKVLIANYGKGLLGLPGGHIDADETPDEAMRRELQEEIGVSGLELRHFDFDRHRDDKIVLFFTGVMSESTTLAIDLEELNSADWVEVSQIANGQAAIGSYTGFILKAYATFDVSN